MYRQILYYYEKTESLVRVFIICMYFSYSTTEDRVFDKIAPNLEKVIKVVQENIQSLSYITQSFHIPYYVFVANLQLKVFEYSMYKSLSQLVMIKSTGGRRKLHLHLEI